MQYKFQKLGLFVAIFFFSLSQVNAQKAKQWQIDKSHASVSFSINHFFSAVPGKFKTFDGDFYFDKENLAGSSLNFTIKVTSVDTDEEERDTHLQTEDFFNAEKYPDIKFVSTKVVKGKKGVYMVHGNLTMKDVTKTVVLPMEITGEIENPWNANKVIMGIAIETTIDRTEYGVGTGSWAATAIVGDEVEISIAMELDTDK